MAATGTASARSITCAQARRLAAARIDGDMILPNVASGARATQAPATGHQRMPFTRPIDASHVRARSREGPLMPITNRMKRLDWGKGGGMPQRQVRFGGSPP
jgi:hypothetical protein